MSIWLWMLRRYQQNPNCCNGTSNRYCIQGRWIDCHVIRYPSRFQFHILKKTVNRFSTFVGPWATMIFKQFQATRYLHMPGLMKVYRCQHRLDHNHSNCGSVPSWRRHRLLPNHCVLGRHRHVRRSYHTISVLDRKHSVSNSLLECIRSLLGASQ